MPYMNYLYSQGYKAYRKNEFFMQLSEEERAYLKNPSPIPLAARYFNYPIDYYNTYEHKWEGLAFDVLREVEELTGLTFTVVNDKHAHLPELYEMVLAGDAYLVPELLISNERREHYIWTEHKFITDQYALISKSHLPNVSANEISHMRVGLVHNTVRSELFRTWFPDAVYVTEYDTDEEAMFAVEHGEMDMVMSSKNRMLSYLNYYGLLDYKANYFFDYPYEATFGFNKNQTVLCSIVDKAIGLIGTNIITEQWMTRTYNYKIKLIEARLPWFIGAVILSFVVLSLILILFYRSRVEEKRLANLLTEVNAANRAKSSFLAVMSHEMRTPMNAIMSMTSIGRNSKDIERKDYALDRIVDTSGHLMGVINDLLDITRIESNRLELSPAEFNLEKMFRKVINIISFRIEEKRLMFTVNIDKNIPRFVIGDDNRLSQVILNLLSNAVKFTPEEGEIGLDVILAGEIDGIYELRITVSDNGIGISGEQLAKLFQAFEQADSGMMRKFGGTGIGLSISKYIIDLMGGKIWVESVFGKGSRFIFTVNVKSVQKNITLADISNESPEFDDGLKIDKSGMFADKKLLIVEDIEINRDVVIVLLEDTGINIDCAENGQEAVDMIAAAPDKYDVILMDIQMPKMDGFEATRRIRALTAKRSGYLPIIAMTAHVFKSDVEECLKAGMDDHIGKPLDIDDVLMKLNKYLTTPVFRMGNDEQ
jgi:signal transduction histidine kinase/ActR/RegA family two-component response regulator